MVDGHGIVNDYFKLQKVDPPGEGGEEGQAKGTEVLQKIYRAIKLTILVTSEIYFFNLFLFIYFSQG